MQLTHLLDGTLFEAIPGAVVAGLIAGTLLPLLGVWVVLQRVVFLGVALSQVAAAGVALGLVLGAPPLPIGLAASLLVTVYVVGGSERTRRAGDGTLGALFCAASALALMFVSRSPAELDEIDHVLRGNLIYAGGPAVLVTAVVLLIAVAVSLCCRRPILFSVFDPETASALGVPARRWKLLLFAVLAISLTVCMRTTGSLLSFAMLVLPPLAAMGLGLGLNATFVFAALFGALGTLGGLTLAVLADLHVESSITVALAAWLPVTRAWRLHPIAGVATVAATLAAGSLLVAQVDDVAPGHPHHHETQDVEEQPWHVDVHLSAERTDSSDVLAISWEVDLIRLAADTPVPESLWIIITGDGVMHEHELLHDLHRFPPGTSRTRGSCLVPAGADVHRVEGQIWSGSMLEPDAEPIDSARGEVIGTDVPP